MIQPLTVTAHTKIKDRLDPLRPRAVNLRSSERLGGGLGESAHALTRSIRVPSYYPDASALEAALESVRSAIRAASVSSAPQDADNCP